eukprot:CAMPEP_0119354534 /NCGR_PEP_ID=MMETSP1334-20130426/3523_1 /TAXON_ID=127549 /ORGANISM="Calcidiscus leptoporus, Strain RCC1130" /LENGTH=117 /DNA_ID=CAMNT_0007368111 /DNA_START=122 /DNA_END=475 /DNA_ORIENTATION=-
MQGELLRFCGSALLLAIVSQMKRHELDQVHSIQTEREDVGEDADVALARTRHSRGSRVQDGKEHAHVLCDLEARDEPLDRPQQSRPPIVRVHQCVNRGIQQERDIEDGRAHCSANKV